MRAEITLLYNDRQKIVGILHLPDGKGKFPCVITCHGYRSTKDSSKYVAIANRLCREGFAVFRFDFRGCGESDGNLEETTLPGRVSDLGVVLNFVRKHPSIKDDIGLLGSSMGGCVAMIRAAEDKKIKAVAAWSTPSISYKIIKMIVTPIQIIHGEADEVVPLSHAKHLYETLNEPKMMEIIKGGNHRLTDPQDRKRAIELSLKWFEKYVKSA